MSIISSCNRGGRSIDDGVFAAKYRSPEIVDIGRGASVVCCTEVPSSFSIITVFFSGEGSRVER